MGGSFDPFHFGHQAMVTHTLALPWVQELWLIPVGKAVHRHLSGHASALMRLQWLRRVYIDEPRVTVLDWEVMNTQPTPTLETLQYFHQQQPRKLPLLVLGMDSFNSLRHWQGYPQHLQYCNLCVFPRLGVTMQVNNDWKPALGHWQQTAGHLLKLSTALPRLSSTYVRQRAQQGLDLEGMVNEKLRQEIENCYGGLN